jgi:hypothetical protein
MDVLKKARNRLELLEIEGKFEVNRSGYMLAPEDRPRNDKTFAYNMENIAKFEEFKDLHTLTKLLYCLPFELNKHASWL